MSDLVKAGIDLRDAKERESVLRDVFEYYFNDFNQELVRAAYSCHKVDSYRFCERKMGMLEAIKKLINDDTLPSDPTGRTAGLFADVNEKVWQARSAMRTVFPKGEATQDLDFSNASEELWERIMRRSASAPSSGD